MVVYSEVSPVVFIGASSQESMHKILEPSYNCLTLVLCMSTQK